MSLCETVLIKLILLYVIKLKGFQMTLVKALKNIYLTSDLMFVYKL